MNNALTELVCVIDRSGSMQSIRDDAIGGFNAFLDSQKQGEGDARLTLVFFNHEYGLVHNAAPIESVDPLTTETFVPRGNTALLDAVGRTIDDVGARLAEAPEAERPGTVLVCILTDGLENASSDYTRDRVKSMIEHQQSKYGWEFQFLAANQDAFAEAGSIGIAPVNAMPFVANAEGTKAAFAQVSARATKARSKK
ncbi:MAG: vWA domain-containing protein [Bacteroidota bacterium]